jgi:hypothetical protein
MADLRLVNITATINGVDDEDVFADERGSATRSSEHLLRPTPTGQPLSSLVCKWGGECRVELWINGKVNDDGSVDIDSHAFLFEGASEETSDLDGQIDYGFRVAKGQTFRDTRRVTNLDEGEDYADISLVISNHMFEG